MRYLLGFLALLIALYLVYAGSLKENTSPSIPVAEAAPLMELKDSPPLVRVIPSAAKPDTDQNKPKETLSVEPDEVKEQELSPYEEEVVECAVKSERVNLCLNNSKWKALVFEEIKKLTPEDFQEELVIDGCLIERFYCQNPSSGIFIDSDLESFQKNNPTY